MLLIAVGGAGMPGTDGSGGGGGGGSFVVGPGNSPMVIAGGGGGGGIFLFGPSPGGGGLTGPDGGGSGAALAETAGLAAFPWAAVAAVGSWAPVAVGSR